MLAARTGARTMHERGMHLVVQRETRRIGTDLRTRETAVLVDLFDIVAGLAPEVQRRIRPIAYTPDTRREHDFVRTRCVPAQVTHASRSFARSSSHSSSFLLGSSTTSSSRSSR